MHLLADENMPGTVISALRQRGHDVLSVKESMRGDDDDDILAHAQIATRTVITRDKDFGELAFRFGLPSSCGVILFRLPDATPDEIVQRMVEVIESQSDWAGCFVVATESRVRVRPLPTA